MPAEGDRGGMKRFTLLFLLLTASVWAKPMPAPTLERAVRDSAVIVEVEYLGFDQSDEVTYFSGPVARYRVLKSLKGNTDGKLRVRYDFTDGSACIAPKEWKFSQQKMPEPGSRWFLFLTGSGSPAGTYRGSFGRQSADPKMRAKIKSLL